MPKQHISTFFGNFFKKAAFFATTSIVTDQVISQVMYYVQS